MLISKLRAGVLLGSALLLAGCVTEVESPQSEPSSDPDQAEQPSEQPTAKHHKRRGHFSHVGMFIHTALEELELTPAQQTSLDELLDDLGQEPVDWQAHEALMSTLAQGLRAGAIDDEAVEEKLAVIERGRQTKDDAMVASFNAVHDTLTAEQRVALVEIIRERGEKRKQRWENKKKEQADDDTGKRHHAHKGGDPTFWFARGVNMTDAQREELRTAMKDAGMEKPSPEAMKKSFAAVHANMKAMYDAFATDDFDATDHQVTLTGSEFMTKGLTHYVEVVKALSVILDDAQRGQLADRLEQGPKL